MNTRDEDDAWRAIVENFGERAVLDDEAPSAELTPEDFAERDTPEHPATREPEGPGPRPEGPAPRRDVPGPFIPGPEHEYDPEPAQPSPSEPASLHDAEGRFVPPTPPLPYVPPKRLLAWSTLALVPVLLIVVALTDRYLSGTMTVLLIAAWVGAFGYLVWTMPTEPRDPFDDGSRV